MPTTTTTTSIIAILAAALGVAATCAAANAAIGAGDETLPPAERILAGFDAALGEKTRTAAQKGIEYSGAVEVAGMPGKGTVAVAAAAADRARLTVDWPGMGSMTFGVTGEKAWTTDPAMGVSVKEGDEAAPVRRLFGLFRCAPWKSLYASAKTTGRADVGGRPHFEIEMSPRSGKPETWFVDCESHLLSRVDLVFPDPMGGEIPMQWHFSDWRKTGGGETLLPFKTTQVAGGMKIDYVFETVTAGESVDPARVAPSDEVSKAIADPAKRTPKAPASGGECSVETIAEQPVASIRLTIKAAEVAQNLAVMLPEVMQHLASSGAQMAGPPFSRYHSLTADTIDIEAGMPVKSPVKGEGRVKASTLPAGKVAATWHVGPYHDLPKTYAVLEAWMKAQSLESRGPFWEVYWTDPGIERDPQKWRTQVFWPVK